MYLRTLRKVSFPQHGVRLVTSAENSGALQGFTWNRQVHPPSSTGLYLHPMEYWIEGWDIAKLERSVNLVGGTEGD
jgi:hypothetical protein